MLSDDYILGFVEGEGCFSITIGRYIDRKPRKTKFRCKKKYPYLFRVNPTFRITQAKDDGFELLKDIRESLGFGRFQIQNRSDKKENDREVVNYYAQGLNECLKVKEYFTQLEFKTSKGKSFEKWCQCLALIQEGKHLIREGLLEICDIRDGMNYRKTKCKWTKEEIIKVLDAKPIHQIAHFNPTQTSLLHNDSFNQKAFLEKKPGNNKASKQVLAQTELA
jgi:hypothetical protein